MAVRVAKLLAPFNFSLADPKLDFRRLKLFTEVSCNMSPQYNMPCLWLYTYEARVAIHACRPIQSPVEHPSTKFGQTTNIKHFVDLK